jgi:hypothetical protein
MDGGAWRPHYATEDLSKQRASLRGKALYSCLKRDEELSYPRFSVLSMMKKLKKFEGETNLSTRYDPQVT